MSAFRALSRRHLVLRAALALCSLYSWRLLSWMLALHVPGSGSAFADGVLRCHAGLTLGMVVACASFAAGRRPLASGAAACALLWTLDRAVTAAGGDEHEQMFAAAVLFVYVGAWALRGGRRAGREEAWEACCAVAGAAYVLAGLSKLRYSGLGWIDDHHLRVQIGNQAAWATGRLRELRLAAQDSPRLGLGLTVGTLAVELSGAAMLLPRARRWYGAAALGLHAGIAVGMDIVWIIQPALLALLAFAPPGVLRRETPPR